MGVAVDAAVGIHRAGLAGSSSFVPPIVLFFTVANALMPNDERWPPLGLLDPARPEARHLDAAMDDVLGSLPQQR